MKHEFSVIVGNIGTVHMGNNYANARREYFIYCDISKSEGLRASGEDVTLTKDGEPVLEFYGSLSDNGEDA